MSDEGLNFAAERRPRLTVHTVFFFKTTTSANQVVTPMPFVIFKQTEKQHTLAERGRERERERLRERGDRANECVCERERETRKMDKTGVCLIELNTSKRFLLTGSAFRLVSGDFQSSGKGRSHKTGTRLATVRLRVRTR